MLILVGLSPLKASTTEFRIAGQAQDRASVRIEFELTESIEQKRIRLYRSTHHISSDTLDPILYPLVTFELTSQDVNTGFLDRSTAQNVTYYYMAAVVSENTEAICSNIIAIATPGVELPQLTQPEIWIDKIHYFLEIRDLGKFAKRYPIILGWDPLKRKLHQDFATTPDGLYRVTNRKLRSTFRHAFDIDYPNSTDRVRYDLLKSAGKVPAGKSIGGDIQIHGQLRKWRLERNWRR
ncbi:MAG: hypothetical protein GQ544_09550 [Candidatus Aminicenantes bacterium]|nr:hypothetical protein [Candidatus Aminicenantes bacterium]